MKKYFYLLHVGSLQPSKFIEGTILCSGYLVTCPRLFRAGSTQELSVSLIDVNETWSINAAVTYRHGRGDIIASGGAQFTDDSDGTLKLEVSLTKGAALS